MKSQVLIAALVGASLTPVFAQAPANRLTIDTTKPGVKVSPLLYGIFFEEINRAGDGGIYAEMVMNRSFEDYQDDVPYEWQQRARGLPFGWQLDKATGTIDTGKPLNAKNPHSLRVEAQAGGSVINKGFVGFGPRADIPAWQRDHLTSQSGQIAVEKGKIYDLSLFARAENALPLIVSLKGKDGNVLASQKIDGLGSDWKKFTVSFTANATDANVSLVISTEKAGTFWLDMVSLFPRDTWKGRKNGLRKDLMEYIAQIKPSFVRFPGGCFVEGREIEDRWQWKNSLGPIEERVGNWNLWDYNITNGLGFHEYLQMCEDLGAEPLYVANAGASHHKGALNGWQEPMEKMGQYVQDALDAIEYANGPVTSKWGAMRAKAGHPQPFNMKMIQIGNEQWGQEYVDRYALFYDAIKKAYPQMRIIGCDPLSGRTLNRPMDMDDWHNYNEFSTFLRQASLYDPENRTRSLTPAMQAMTPPKVYIGEFAQTADAGQGHLMCALSESAYMTGLERNSDVVEMCSYAPLLVREGWGAWNPNAIHFDQSRIFGTPSYWAQVLFSNNRADQNLPVTLNVKPSLPQPITGKVGIGTWGSPSEFKDVKVVAKDGKVLLDSDFSNGLGVWKRFRGQWTTENGVLKQTSDENNTMVMAGEENWTDYTFSLKARKLSGPEGFLITFGARNEGDRQWWNIGGWGNTQSAVESADLQAPGVPFKIETGRWYDIKVELNGTNAKFYIDGQLIQEINREPLPAYQAVAGLDQKTGETILKFVNASNESRTVKLDLNGAKPGKIAGQAWVLTSANGRDENSFDAPNKVAPRTETLSADTADFTRTFPANSVSILRWK